MYEFKMPTLGAEMEYGTLLEWKIGVGDQVKRHDIVAVIDTDKAAIDIESYGEGIVETLIAKPGDKIAVGTVIARFRERDEAPQPMMDKMPSAHIKISPMARKLAHELQIDLKQIKGSGPDGAIVEADIRQAMSTPVTTTDHMASMQAVIAAAMAKSKREIPHYYLTNEIELKTSMEWLKHYNEQHPVQERLVYAALLIRAVVQALKTYPAFNGYFQEHVFQVSQSVHVGMAISLRNGGLMTPAILDADQLNLSETMQHLTDLVSRTRSGKLKSAELSSATITITNLGELGVDSVFGVIYPPQVALLGFGKIRSNQTLIATLAADHRVTNGLIGSHFLSTIANLLQKPELL